MAIPRFPGMKNTSGNDFTNLEHILDILEISSLPIESGTVITGNSEAFQTVH